MIFSAVDRLNRAHDAIQSYDFDIVFGSAEREMSVTSNESLVEAGSRFIDTIRSANKRVDDLAECIALLGGGRSDLRPELYDAREDAAFEYMEKGFSAGLLIVLGGVEVNG